MEKNIIQLALDNLNKATGIQAIWERNDTLDGYLHFTLNQSKYKFVVEVKREIRNHQIPEIERCFHTHDNFLLVAQRIYRKAKDHFRERKIPYLEANGNIFIEKEGVFLFVDTNKPLDIRKTKGNRAYTKTGLKVLFYLLQYKDAINLTQRELAEETEVALGNIPQIIEGLKETGFLLPLDGKNFIWEKRKELLDKWVGDYATTLRPTLNRVYYALPGNWKDITFDHTKTLWGGEAAADILTNFLRPEKFIIYTREDRVDLIKKYGLRPDENGEVEVLDLFWKQINGRTVPPILVYADLMREGGKRNIETAKIIYDEFIKPDL